MVIKGSEVIDFLAEQAVKDDPGESSHWKYFHSNFTFKEGGVSGLQGF